MPKEAKKTEEKQQKESSNLMEDISYLESYARELFSFSPLPICFVSPIGVILEINPAFEHISGYKAHEIVGEPIENFFREKEINDFLKETIRNGFIREKELYFKTKEKSERIVSAFSQVRKIKEGDVIGCFISFFDMTAIKKVEMELKDSQTALMNILEDVDRARKRSDEEKNKTLAIITNFADGLMVFDADSNLSLVNLEAEKIFDVKGRDVIKRYFGDLGTFPTLKPLVELFKKDLQKEIFRQELFLREDLILEVSSILMENDKERIGTLVILHNITREKTVEKLKSEFVSLAAHQLRTPLSAIKWTLSMLLDGDLGPINEEQKSFIEKTFISNERMIALINDLLDSTRIEEGKYIYKLVSSDLRSQIQRVLDSLKEEIKKKGLKLEFEEPKEDLPKVKIDEEKIRLVVDNLLDNAIKYSSIGGCLKINIEKIKSEIRVSITNCGIGIPEDQKQRVFSKFFRGSNAIKTETEGTGLGLFISKNIIEAHSGKMWFESVENKETTFYFTLPAEKNFENFLKRL